MQRVEGQSIYFYCQVQKGIDLEVLSSTDIIADTKRAIQTMEKKRGKIKGLINFNCILKTLQLDEEKKNDACGALFNKIPMIGFSTYGEAYIGHMNQTAVMLVFY